MSTDIFLCIICCFVVTVLCFLKLHSWILGMDPKSLTLLAISHIKSVASVSLARSTVQMLDFIERDITDMSSTYTEEMKHSKPSVRRCRRGKWLLSRIILPPLTLGCVLSVRNREDGLFQKDLCIPFGVLASAMIKFSEGDISWSGDVDLVTNVVNALDENLWMVSLPADWHIMEIVVKAHLKAKCCISPLCYWYSADCLSRLIPTEYILK